VWRIKAFRPEEFQMMGQELSNFYLRHQTGRAFSAAFAAVRFVGPDTLKVLLGAVLGILLTAGWDTWKVSRDETNGLNRAARIVRFEIEQNSSIINRDLDYISQDVTASEQELEAVSPITLLSHSSGDYAIFGGSFDQKSKNITYMLSKLYEQITDTNRHIEFRENYRNANESMNNFHRRRRLIDLDLKKNIIGVADTTAQIKTALVRKNLWGK
jgi:hypothetical protein